MNKQRLVINPDGPLAGFAASMEQVRQALSTGMGLEVIEVPTPWYMRLFEWVFRFFRRLAFGLAFIVMVILGAPVWGVMAGIIDVFEMLKEWAEDLE